MGISDRYKRILRTSSENLAKARNSRILLAETRQQLRTAAEDADEIVDYTDAPSSPAPSAAPSQAASAPPSSPLPVFISTEMRKKLKDLGYAREDLQSLTPEIAQDIIAGGITKKQRESAAAAREKALDDLEEHVLADLQAIKKRLDLANKRLPTSQKLLDQLDEKLTSLVEESEGTGDTDRQDAIQEEISRVRAHAERAEHANLSIRREISALEKLISSISKTEDGLIEELQEANDASLLTLGTEDDALINSILKSKKEELQKISELRKQLAEVHGRMDKKTVRLLKLHREITDLVEVGGNRASLNVLRDEVVQVQAEADAIEKEHQNIVRLILRHENALRDKQTESRLQELESALKDLPDEVASMEKLKQKAKDDVADEDVGKEISSKPKKYKQEADAMLAFVEKTSQIYGDFIISYLAPDIPSDPKIDAFIKAANDVILKRAGEAQKLAVTYGRNPMQRSAILLVPSLYEFLASTMNGVVSKEEVEQDSPQEISAKIKEAEVLYHDFVEAGMVKEALWVQDFLDSLKDKSQEFKDNLAAAWDAGKDIGRGVGDAAGKGWSSVKNLGKAIQERVFYWREALDRMSFKKEDVGKRLDPAAVLKQQQLSLYQLRAAEKTIQEDLVLLREMHQQSEQAGDQRSASDARDGIIQLQKTLLAIGEQKNILEKGLAHSPSPGQMKEQEALARRPKTDREQAVALMKMSTPAIEKFLRTGIPNDAALEKELLRQSSRVVAVVQKMATEGEKAKKKYPNLHHTVHAYARMFLAIDEVLQSALRFNKAAA